MVIRRHSITDTRSEFALVYRRVICLEILIVLRVYVLKLANRRHTERIKIRSGLRRVSLKIAIQRPFLLGNREFVRWLGEMVHTDIFVTRIGQFLARHS